MAPGFPSRPFPDPVRAAAVAPAGLERPFHAAAGEWTLRLVVLATHGVPRAYLYEIRAYGASAGRTCIH